MEEDAGAEEMFCSGPCCLDGAAFRFPYTLFCLVCACEAPNPSACPGSVSGGAGTREDAAAEDVLCSWPGFLDGAAFRFPVALFGLVCTWEAAGPSSAPLATSGGAGTDEDAAAGEMFRFGDDVDAPAPVIALAKAIASSAG
jgi:hypothetical protein